MSQIWISLAAVIVVFMIPVQVRAASNVLTWTDNANNEAAFHIERKAEACTGPAAFVEIATTGPNTTTVPSTYTDAAVIEGATYCYRVAASNSAGKSAYSNTAGRTVPFTVPAAPSGLGVAGGL